MWFGDYSSKQHVIAKDPLFRKYVQEVVTTFHIVSYYKMGHYILDI